MFFAIGRVAIDKALYLRCRAGSCQEKQLRLWRHFNSGFIKCQL